MAAAATRSVLRSSALLRNAAARNVVSEVGAARPALRLLRSPVETVFCGESLLPIHGAIASSLMTSMLSVSRRGYGCLSEAVNDDV